MPRRSKPTAEGLNLDGLPLDFPDLDTLIDPAAEMDGKTIAATLGVKEFIRTKRHRYRAHRTVDARKVEKAAETLERLPAENESIHIVVGNSFAGIDLLPAMLRLSEAKGYETLYLTTLGCSRDNLAALEMMLKARQIRPATLRILCGDFFRRADSGLWDIGALLAKERRFGFRSFRNHTKLILAHIAGRHIVVESSANLRSCSNIEMFTITESRPLFDFHKGWIDEVWPAAQK